MGWRLWQRVWKRHPLGGRDGDDFRYPFRTVIGKGRILAGWTAFEDYVAALTPEAALCG